MHFAGPAPVIPGSSIPISLGSPLILHDNTECFFPSHCSSPSFKCSHCFYSTVTSRVILLPFFEAGHKLDSLPPSAACSMCSVLFPNHQEYKKLLCWECLAFHCSLTQVEVIGSPSSHGHVIAITIKDGISLFLSNSSRGVGRDHLNPSVQSQREFFGSHALGI